LFSTPKNMEGRLHLHTPLQIPVVIFNMGDCAHCSSLVEDVDLLVDWSSTLRIQAVLCRPLYYFGVTTVNAAQQHLDSILEPKQVGVTEPKQGGADEIAKPVGSKTMNKAKECLPETDGTA
jgi:hypothetical protein